MSKLRAEDKIRFAGFTQESNESSMNEEFHMLAHVVNKYWLFSNIFAHLNLV